jgi:hypothetical protein
MIYVIASAAFKEENVNKYETILKIGYTNDKRGDGRFEDYKTTNPTCKVLYKIPGGTPMDEIRLHMYFKEFKYPETKEWFYYNERIIDFFKINTNLSLIYQEIGRWFEDDDSNRSTLKYVDSVSSFNDSIWPYLVEAENKSRRIVYEENFNPEHVDRWLNRCGYPESEVRNILRSYNNTKAKLTPEIYEYIYRLRDSNIPIEKRLRELCESQFTNEDKKLIARQTSNWFYKFGNILGLDRCSELNYNISNIVKEICFIERKDEISARVYRKFEVKHVYSEEEVQETLIDIFKGVGIYDALFNTIDFIKKYFEIDEVDSRGLEFLSRTNIFKRRYSDINYHIWSSKDGRASKGFWDLSDDVYNEFLVGKTYKSGVARLKFLDICERHKLNMDSSFVKAEEYLCFFFKIEVYDTTVSSIWRGIYDKNIELDGTEIDILEKLEPPSDCQ